MFCNLVREISDLIIYIRIINYILLNAVVSIDRLTFYLNDLRETSARLIQTAWRGYRARRKFAEVRDERKREKVRHC